MALCVSQLVGVRERWRGLDRGVHPCRLRQRKPSSRCKREQTNRAGCGARRRTAARTTDIDEDTSHHEREHEVGATVRNKWQGQPGCGKQTDCHADMEVSGQHNSDGQPNGDKLEKRRARLPRDPETQRTKSCESNYQEHDSDKAPLFSNMGRYEVVVSEWEESVLLPAFAEADAKDLTRSDGNQRLL